VAHEYVHGVTAHTSNLIYQDQPGALNEALSDIFGEMVEARTTGRTDWEMGTNLPAAIRSLRDPASWQIGNSGYYYPSRMSEYYGRNHSLLQSLPDQDYGGVHINMTIITRCFYLLAESLPGAIGIQEAADIFFRANQVHLVQNSQFIDMRLAAIVSAEELFGPGSHQARKVAEAFDAVEIFESQVLPPDPSPEPPVSGEESAVFISEDSGGGYFLARYEKALGDEEPGTWLSCFDVAPARPSVSGDGSEVFFVDSINDACFIDTDPGNACEWCLEMPGEIYSVAMSFDRKLYGFVFLDADGEPIDEIGVIDLRSDDEPRVFSLRAPSTEGVLLNTVLFADSMFFTADNRYLIYDAFNVIEFEDRTRLGVWSIYAIELATGQTIPLVGPFTNAHVGFPSPGKVSNNLITFDLLPDNSNDTIVVAMDMVSGENKIVATVNDAWSIPGYSGDDRAILYSRPDPLVPTGYSYARQPLAANGIDPVGDWARFVRDGFFGVAYRRGDYAAPVGEIAVLPDGLDFGSVRVDELDKKSVTIQNQGNGDLMVYDVFLTGAGQDAYRLSGGCTGQRLKASASCTVFVSFSPDEPGEKSAQLRVESDDQTLSMAQISVSGEGVGSRDSGGGSSGCFMGCLKNAY